MKITAMFVGLAGLFSISCTIAKPCKREECHPDVSGRSVSVSSSSGALEWGKGELAYERPLSYEAPTSNVGEFTFELTGDEDSSYYIKAAESDLYATRSPRGNVMLWSTGPTRWYVNCSYCSPNDASTAHGTYASGCTISTNGFCVAEESNSGVGSYQKFNGCEGSSSESWDLILS